MADIADASPMQHCTGAEGEGEPEGEGDVELAALEEELTREVPTLMETMNRSSMEVNTLERKVSEAQARYKRLLEKWSRLYEDVRAQHGAAIDRAKPWFEAGQVFDTSSANVQRAVREFSAASTQHTQSKRDLKDLEQRLAYGAHKVKLDGDQQDGLSRATVRVLRCQQERDRREQEYARALREYQEAQEALENWRAQIGDTVIKRAVPCYRQLQQFQQKLATEQTWINALTERVQKAKASYNNSLRELDRISNAVHDVRRSHGKGSPRPKVEAAPAESAHKEATKPEAEPALAAAAVDDGPFA